MCETRKGSRIIEDLGKEFATKSKRKGKKSQLGMIQRAFSDNGNNGKGKRGTPPGRG
jgi:hypothetical protein